MVVAPHPDDETVGCGGTLLRHRRRGDQVAVVCVTDGRGRPGSRPDPEGYARSRRAELERAASILGVEQLTWLGLPEWRWEAAELAPPLAAEVGSWSPDLLYLPSRVDYHPEHREVARAAALALDGGPGPTVRVYQVQAPLTSVLVNLASDVSSVGAELDRALAAHASQHDTIRACLRLKRYAASFHGRGSLLEEFWEMPAARYRALHAGEPDRWCTGSIRGLRRRPLSDPLAYLVGRSARRALAHTAPDLDPPTEPGAGA
jgi:LmbE family N-acetylglucosaminyl deacetylase